MNIILLTKFRGRPCRVQIDHPFQLSILSLFGMVLMFSAGFVGYYTGLNGTLMAFADPEISGVFEKLSKAGAEFAV